MLNARFVFLFVAVASISIWDAYCLTAEEEAILEEVLTAIVMECSEHLEIPLEDLKKDDPRDIDPRFKKCFLQKIGIVDKGGKYNGKAVKEQIIASTDNDDIARKIIETMDICVKEREDEIKNDDEKRIDVIFLCLSEYKEKK